MSAVVMKVMLLGVTPCNFVMGAIIAQEHKTSIFFFSENAGTVV
jgi:hypothetical protein